MTELTRVQIVDLIAVPLSLLIFTLFALLHIRAERKYRRGTSRV